MSADEILRTALERGFIKRHPVVVYFALTFAISWTNVLLIVGGFGGIPGTPEKFESMIPLVGLAMLAGPSVAGVLLTYLTDGKAGLRELLSRLLRWRCGARWTAIALLTAPLAMTAIPLALSALFPEFLPGVFTKEDKATLMHASLTTGNVVLVPSATGVPLVVWSLVMAVAFWSVVVAVFMARGGLRACVE